MDNSQATLTICGMAAVTILCRAVPFAVLGKRNLPPVLVRWLGFVPVAVLSAMLFPEVMLKADSLYLEAANLPLWVSIAAFAAGFATRNLFFTIFFAIAALALLRCF